MKKIDKNDVKNVLVTRTDRLGDVILTLPLINESKEIFGRAKIFFLVKQNVAELIRDYEGIDELIIEENTGSFYNKYKFFKQKKIDLVINAKPEFDFALLFFLLGTKYRIGTGYRWYSFLYNCKVYEHRKVSDKHESDYNLNLLKSFFDDVSMQKKFNFNYSKDEKSKLLIKLDKLNLYPREKYIIIHPGSGSSAKDLPLIKYSGFINSFFKEFSNYNIVFTGLKNENSLIEEILKNNKSEHDNNLINLCGLLNLKELLILIDNADLFISNSTGPIHIAGALNKNIIGFYPNEKPMSETRWKPLSENAIILKPDENCDMNSINEEQIMRSTRNFLN